MKNSLKMSFCRITGKARGLPKPNYFPLLPPISPADAKRFCRITGKAYGLPGHHYTPVLLVRQSRRKACTVTGGSAGGNVKHHYPSGSDKSDLPEKKDFQEELLQPQRHVVVADFRYVFPTLEESTEFEDILAPKKENAFQLPVEEQDRRFVYTVAERRCSLVIPARLEAAVREGEVKGVLLADDTDEVRFQFKEGKDVTIGVKELETPKEQELWEGEGPSEAAQKAQASDEAKPKPKKKRKKEGLSCMTKIFEEKERVQDVEIQKNEEIKAKRAKVVEVKLSTDENSSIEAQPTIEDDKSNSATSTAILESNKSQPLPEPQRVEWHQFDPQHHRVDANLVMCTGDWRDLVKPLIESWDWDEFEREAAAVAQGAAVVTQLPRPVALRADTSLQEPQPYATPTSEALAAFGMAGTLPVTTAVAPLSPLVAEPAPELQVAISAVPKKSLSKTSAVTAVLQKDEAARALLPVVQEIPHLISELEKGKPGKIGPKAQGLMVDIGAAKKFIAGQNIETPSGPVFVPGQTVDTPNGPIFVPGMTVNTENGPILIPGQKVDTPSAGPTFVAGRFLKTVDGLERFVAGQNVDTSEGIQFMPGQTVITAEGPKFIPGQTVISVDNNKVPAKFVPGHTVVHPQGPAKFVPGQTVVASDGAVLFVPGQSILDTASNTWEFVPGQVQTSSNGDMQFVAGQTIPTAEGPKFVPGRTVISASGATEFVPGVTVQENDGSLRFVPGRTVQTPEGPKFMEGHVVQTQKGPMFAPGRVEAPAKEGDVPKFSLAKCFEDAIMKDAATPIKVVTEEEPAGEAVFGHMVQTGKGVAFFPGTRAAGLPAGKLVPGRLLRSATSGDVKFIPGIEVFEEGTRRFVPGQVVETERGEQFVPGQVVDTADGPKFVPGQVVETRAGNKFVPGQTVDTPDGPKFVPGQIVETKAGPTFIPGQVISTTEEGSKFVPGQVVETAEGPRFVPGRVVETGDRVTFVPGQVVETKEGLRFVAPDLEDGCEFSVQGFEITPEELKLLRPQVGSTTTTSEAVAALDSKVLQQLSAAGVAVGRHVPADLPGVAVSENAILNSDTVRGLTARLELESEKSVLLADVLGTVLRLSNELLEQARSTKDLQRLKDAAVDSSASCDDSVKEFVRSLVSAVALTASQQPGDAILNCAGEVLGELLLGVDAATASTLVQSLHAFLSAPGSVRDLRNDARAILRAECKLDLLRSLVADTLPELPHTQGQEVIESIAIEEERATAAVERLAAVLGDQGREEVLGEAFARLSEGRPQLVGRVIGKVSECANNVVTERDASDVVQRAIVSAVRESSERQLKAILEVDDALVSEETEEEMRNLVGEAVGLARALGLFDAADTLLDVLEDPAMARALAADDVAMDVLHRLTVMRTLAAKRPDHVAALRKLQDDPFEARDDPHLRELVRDSAVLLVEPQSVALLTSVADVPAALLLADNRLAVEDFLARSGHRAGPLLILKPGLQTVIPREASRAVLTGQCSYTVLDNNGIRYFEPLHVLSALRLPRVATHRFTMYRCAVAGADVSSMTSSSEDLGSSSWGRPADSVLGGSFGSATTASMSTNTRRRSSAAPPPQSLLSTRRVSIDTGTGTATATATASPSSDGLDVPMSLLPEPRQRHYSGYLDSETRRRIANALVYGDPLPSRRPLLTGRSLASSASTSPIRTPSPPPKMSRRHSRSQRKPRPTDPPPRRFSPPPTLSSQVFGANGLPDEHNQDLLNSRRSPSPIPLRKITCVNGTADIPSEVREQRSPSPPVTRRLSRVLKANIAAKDIKETPHVNTFSRDSSPESPMTKDYNKVIDYKESSPLRRLSSKYASFLGTRAPSPEPKPKAEQRKSGAVVNHRKNKPHSHESSPPPLLQESEGSVVGYGTRTTARSVRESSFDDELTPNQRRILKQLRVNHVATLRAKEMYDPPSRDSSPTPTPITVLPRILQDISTMHSSDYSSPLDDNVDFPTVAPASTFTRKRDRNIKQKRNISPPRYTIRRDISPVKPISAYMPASLRSRERAEKNDYRENSPSGVSFRTVRLLRELSPQARSSNTFNSDSCRPLNSYRSEDTSPSSRGISSYRSKNASPSGQKTASHLSEPSPIGHKIHSSRIKDISPSNRIVNSHHAKDTSPSTRSSSRDSSPMTFIPRRTQIRLPDLSPPREYRQSDVNGNDPPQYSHRRQSEDAAISPVTTRRIYGLQRHHTDAPPARFSHLYRSPGESASKQSSRTYRFERMGGSSPLRGGRGGSPSDALRFDSASPTEPLSLGSFRTESETESGGRVGSTTPDDPSAVTTTSLRPSGFVPTPAATAQT